MTGYKIHQLDSISSEEKKMDFTGKRILITGGAGYLASGLISMLKDLSCRIIRLDYPGAVFLPVHGEARVEDVKGDLREHNTIEGVLEGVDIVFHFAAQTSTYVANENPFDDLHSNVVPILHLLESCRRHNWHPSVLFASTVTIAGIPVYLPVDENHPENPITVYDLHKLMSETYLKFYVKQKIVDGASLRLSNVYGPGPKSSRSDRGILNQMIRKALAGEVLTVYGEGNQLRDYVYIDDVAMAFLAAAGNIEQINGEHFVIGSGQGSTITNAMNTVADRAASRTGKRVEVKHIEPPSLQSPIESRNFVADTGKFSEATGWKARYTLVEGVNHTVDSFI